MAAAGEIAMKSRLYMCLNKRCVSDLILFLMGSCNKALFLLITAAAKNSDGSKAILFSSMDVCTKLGASV